MARILRGEIYWADRNPVRGQEQGGHRPVVIISQDVFNERSGTVITMAITSQIQRAGFPLIHKLSNGGLPKESWVKMSRVRTLSTSRLGDRIGKVVPEELAILIEGLNKIIAA
jgi:mRNA interferase MazF